MRFRLLAVFAVFAMVFAFAYSADAQMMTTDVVFIKAGYIPSYTVSFDEESGTTGDPDDDEYSGFAVQGEYNLNMSPLWLGFGVEYQNLKTSDFADDYDATAHFIQPMVSAKFVTDGGLYVGAGISGKYLASLSVDMPSGEDIEIDKEFDFWLNGIVGFFMPIAEGVYLDLEGRFGYNLTNKQWESGTLKTGGVEYDIENKMDSAYDFAIYVGIGFRAAATGI